MTSDPGTRAAETNDEMVTLLNQIRGLLDEVQEKIVAVRAGEADDDSGK